MSSPRKVWLITRWLFFMFVLGCILLDFAFALNLDSFFIYSCTTGSQLQGSPLLYVLQLYECFTAFVCNVDFYYFFSFLPPLRLPIMPQSFLKKTLLLISEVLNYTYCKSSKSKQSSSGFVALLSPFSSLLTIVPV